ncbi:MAG: PepSY domain-containing protein, partial [Terriglobia bacterium]
ASTVPRLGDTALFWLTRLHFGRWGGIPTKVLWTIFGLVPAVLFITGAYMWWNRAVRSNLDTRDIRPTTSTPSVPLEPKTPLTGTPA